MKAMLIFSFVEFIIGTVFVVIGINESGFILNDMWNSIGLGFYVGSGFTFILAAFFGIFFKKNT